MPDTVAPSATSTSVGSLEEAHVVVVLGDLSGGSLSPKETWYVSAARSLRSYVPSAAVTTLALPAGPIHQNTSAM